jgi:hypothetical protein
MALVIKDRVQETATVTTTGPFQLAGAVTGYQAFSVIGNTNTTFYAATDTGGRWEVGIGTYATGSPNTLTRTTVLSSSNSDVIVTAFSGTITVFCTYPSGKSVNQDASGNVTVLSTLTGAQVVASNGLIVNNNTVSANYSIPSGSSAFSVGPISVANGVSVSIPNGSRWVIV